MNKNASTDKLQTSSTGTKKQNVIIFKPDEIAKFGLFGDSLAGIAGTSGTEIKSTTISGETVPTTSRHDASVTPKIKWMVQSLKKRPTRKSVEVSTISDDKTELESSDSQSGIDVKRKIGDILKKTFEEMKKLEPEKFQAKGTSSVSGTKISLDCDTKSEIVSLLKLAKDKKEAGIETEVVEKDEFDSSKKVKVIGITSVKYSDKEIQSILKGHGQASNVSSNVLKNNNVMQSDGLTASEVNTNVSSEQEIIQNDDISENKEMQLPKIKTKKLYTPKAGDTSESDTLVIDNCLVQMKTQSLNIKATPSHKTFRTESSKVDSYAGTEKNQYDHDNANEDLDLEEKLIPSFTAKSKKDVSDASCEHLESRASKNLSNTDEVATEVSDVRKSPTNSESVTSQTEVEKVSQVQTELNIDSRAGFDYYIIQFPPNAENKSKCDNESSTDKTNPDGIELEPVVRQTEESKLQQSELNDSESQNSISKNKETRHPANKMEDIDIEDELSYSVLTMDQSDQQDRPKDEVSNKRESISQDPRDTDISTSEKVVKVINVEKHPEPLGDESIFKVNVVLEGSKPEVVDSVSWHPRKRKQQIDCKVDEEEPVEKRSKPRGRKKKIKDDGFIVDSSIFENVRQNDKKSHVGNQKPGEEAGGGASDVFELEDLVAVKHEDLEDEKIVEETVEEVLPMDLQQIPMAKTKPTPKKRGRPRRIKQPYMEEDIPATVFCPLEASKSGRKRRKINYFNLENSLYGEMDEKSSGKKKGRPRKVKVEDDVQTDESFAESSADFSLAETLIQSETFANHNPGVQTSEFINEPETSKEVLMSLDKVRKYRRTGKTVEMVNSIFTAAMNTLNEAHLDRSVDGQKEQTPVNMVKRIKLKGKRDRRCKKEETFELNEKNEVTCVVCQAKVPVEEWDDHNSTVHYDLSWRAGENILLDIDLETFVKKKVEPFLKRLKRLICDKCQAEFDVSSEFIKHREECYGILVNNMVICALCKEEMAKDKFYGHRQKKHNSLAWRVGDIPLDLTNQHFVMSVLNGRYKAKKPLYCYKCDTAKKSVIGYLSHQSQCGVNENDAKIPCPECGRKVLPVSMPVHIKMVHETPRPNKMTMEYPVLDEKRRAAKNAMSIITSFSKGNLIGDTSKYYVENPEFTEDFVKYYLQKEANTNKLIKCKFKGCKFTTLDVNIMVSHLISCDSKPLKHFTCRKCLDSYGALDELSVHMKDVHNKNVEDESVQFSDEGSDEDGLDKGYMMRKAVMQRAVQKTKKAEIHSPYKVKPLCIAKIPRPGRSLLFTSAFEYNLEFCNNYFSQSELFNHLHCTKENWKLIDENLIQTYLPQSEISCEVGIKQVHGFEEVNQCFFNRFELFEVKIQENHVTMYCGGPINALCWLPTPYLRLDCRQVLAVAVTNDFETKYYMKANYAEPTAIQLWDFGNLKNKHSITMPRLMYCISLNIGPVWHMEWCPSGCFDESSSTNDVTFNRLGLLAVAGSVPEVHIYAIPKISEEDWGLVYRTKPVLKLKLSNTQDCGRGSYYPTKISWCKASRHSIVAVGYTNGMVAMFNLDCDSSLLKFKDEDEVDVLLPYKSIQAHTFSISILHVLHHANGDRWLLTGGMDKSYIWDLRNETFINISPKKLILDGIWLTHWLSSITTHDEINLVKGGTNASQLNCLRKYLSDTGSVVASQTSVNSISSSDWLNAVITGNLSGEILAYFPQQMLFNAQEDKCRAKYKKTLGYAKLIKKGITEKKAEEEIDNPDVLEYKKAVTKYGVVFCDFKMDKPEDLPTDHGQKLNSSNKYEEKPRPNLYPLQTINKISFNPNCQASLYYATGYQIGFVRVSYLRFLDSDKQVV